MRNLLLVSVVCAAGVALVSSTTEAKKRGNRPGARKSTPAMLNKAAAHYDDLEYEKALPILEQLLKREDLTLQQRRQAYELQAKSLAISGNALRAEQAFRFVLRTNPAFDLPESTSPRILRVLRKVQAEERAIAAQLREQEREAILRTLAIEGELGTELPGGEPLSVAFQLRDPRGAVSSLRLEYRRSGEAEFSSLPLSRREDGVWLGTIPADWTVSESGFDLEYFLTTLSAEGDHLLSLGSPMEPRLTQVLPGELQDQTPFYRTTWFWAVTAGAVVALGVAGWVIYDQRPQLPEGDVPAYELP